MTEPFAVKVIQNESVQAGHALLRVSGVDRAPLDETFVIRRVDEAPSSFESDWPSGPRRPQASEWHEDTHVLELLVGPDVVNPIPGGTPVCIRMPGLGNREALLTWPDGLLLATARNPRRGQSRKEVAVPVVARAEAPRRPVVDPRQQQEERARQEAFEAEKRREQERRQQEEAQRQRREQEDAERQRLEQERQQREETERQRLAAERQQREAAEKRRLDDERRQREEAEKQRQEQERREQERQQQERLEQERQRQEREERERQEREQRQRQEREQRERQEREQRERQDREQAARQREAEHQRLETQRLETQRLETQRLEAQRLEAQRLEEEARRAAALPSIYPTPQPPPVQRDVQPTERKASRGLIGAAVALIALAVIGGALYMLLRPGVTPATPPKIDLRPPEAPKACKDPQSDYAAALNIYFKSKTEAARLLTCVINGSDEELAEKARKLRDDLQPAN